MTDPRHPEEPSKRRDDEDHPILEAFNAEGVAEAPDEPLESEPQSPAADSDVQPPG